VKADELITEMEALYDMFLAAVQRPEVELLESFANDGTRKGALAQAVSYGDLIYRLLGETTEPRRMRSLVI
jgi:hypothetical protein